MMHVYRDTTERHDEEGRRLPPFVKVWVTCDLCQKSGPVVHGDTEYDKGSARAGAGLVSVTNTTDPKSRDLCETCRTVTFEYHSHPDDRGRYHFAILWYEDCQWDERGKAYLPEDEGPHVRQRGQHFFCDPLPYIESHVSRGFKIVEINKR